MTICLPPSPIRSCLPADGRPRPRINVSHRTFLLTVAATPAISGNVDHAGNGTHSVTVHGGATSCIKTLSQEMQASPPLPVTLYQRRSAILELAAPDNRYSQLLKRPPFPRNLIARNRFAAHLLCRVAYPKVAIRFTKYFIGVKLNQAVIKSKKSTILHLLIESFFAILPLVVLGFAWPGQSKDETTTFVATPEWSLTACVFYGLALARLQLAATVPLRSGAEHPHLVWSYCPFFPYSA